VFSSTGLRNDGLCLSTYITDLLNYWRRDRCGVFSRGDLTSQQSFQRNTESLTNSTSNNQPTDINPYAAPQNYGSPVKANGTIGLAIPEPSFGKACGIVFLHSFALLVINILFGMMGLGAPIDSLVGILVGFVLAVFLYGAMLPTTPGRAAVIYLFQIRLHV